MHVRDGRRGVAVARGRGGDQEWIRGGEEGRVVRGLETGPQSRRVSKKLLQKKLKISFVETILERKTITGLGHATTYLTP